MLQPEIFVKFDRWKDIQKKYVDCHWISVDSQSLWIYSIHCIINPSVSFISFNSPTCRCLAEAILLIWLRIFCWFTLLYNEGTDLFHFIPGLPTSVKSILQFPPDDWWPLTGRTAQISSIVNLMALTTWDIKRSYINNVLFEEENILGKISIYLQWLHNIGVIGSPKFKYQVLIKRLCADPRWGNTYDTNM